MDGLKYARHSSSGIALWTSNREQGAVNGEIRPFSTYACCAMKRKKREERRALQMSCCTVSSGSCKGTLYALLFEAFENKG
jgi:hypothetical protein